MIFSRLSLPLFHKNKLFINFKKLSQKLGPQNVKFNYLQGKHEGIAVLGLNRPEQKNAFNFNLVNDLLKCIGQIQYENTAKVVIVCSTSPGIFCAGADLKERVQMSPKEVNEFVTSLRNLMNKLDNLPVPILAAIDGTAVGGGLELALACDIRIASAEAKMGLVETKLAIIPGAGGTQRLPRIVGISIAKELIYTAKIINGKTAHKLGLVNHFVDQNEKGEAAFNKCLEIAENILPNGPLAVKMAKKAINKGYEVDLSTGLSIEEACYAQIIPTEDRLEGLNAFKEKRIPSYKGV